MNKDKSYTIFMGTSIFIIILMLALIFAWFLINVGGFVKKMNNISDMETSIYNNSINSDISVSSSKEKLELTELEKTSAIKYLKEIYCTFPFLTLPEFDNINEADDVWIWNLAFTKINQQAVTHDDLLESAKQLFGNDLNITPDPIKSGEVKENVDHYMFFDDYENPDIYVVKPTGAEGLSKLFFIDEMSKNNKNETILNIYEYTLDEKVNIESNEKNYILGKDDKLVYIVKTSDNNFDYEKYVLENKNSFQHKVVTLKLEEGRYVIKSSKNV